MKKSKIIALALAGTLTATVMLAGTYAWTSISQRAMNEVEGEVNPGGRLHDDFDGTNKDIYVENFTEENEGAIIYARVKLDEYLEIGGRPVTQEEVTDPEKLPKKDDPSTWTTFKLSEEESSIFRYYYDWTWGDGTVYMPTFNKNKDSLEADINGTFVGLDGDRATTDDKYKDYTAYTKGMLKYGLEIYDIDGDTRDEDQYVSEEIIKALHDKNGGIAEYFYNNSTKYPDPIAEGKTVELPATKETGDPVMDNSDPAQQVKYTATVVEMIYATEGDPNREVIAVTLDIARTDKNTDTETEPDVEADVKVAVVKDAAGTTIQHEAEETLGATVMTMTEWFAKDCPTGEFWVYDDTDGWAYWAQGIQPGTATGCLLTGIQQKGSVVDKYYYAINVTAEFATAGDWGVGTVDTLGGTGFYKNSISEDGLYLLNTIAGGEKNLIINVPTEFTAVTPDESLALTASVKLGGQTVTGDQVVWAVTDNKDGNTTIQATDATRATLKVGANETANYVTVTASLKNVPEVTSSRQIKIGDVYRVTLNNEDVYLAAENVMSTTLSATVTDQRGNFNYSGVEWSLVGTADGVEIDEDTGVLTISPDVDATTIKVKATAKADNKTTIEGTIAVASQMDYIANKVNMDKDITEKDRIVTVDGEQWYVVDIADANTSVEGKEALLWAVNPVKGWQRGDQTILKEDGSTTTATWVGWAYYGGQSPFKYDSAVEGTIQSGGENWWRYSNVRAWLNSAETKTGLKYKDADGNLILSETAEDYAGFLAGKDIISANAVPTDITTRKEWNTTGETEADFDTVTGDKVFIFTQADIYGTSTRVEIDETTGEKKKDDQGNYVVNTSYATPVVADYTVDPDLQPELYKVRTASGKWHWLRSPRHYANVSIVSTDGNVNDASYQNARGCVRPALWLNLSSTAQ